MESARERSEGQPPVDTLPLRIEEVRRFYQNLDFFDPCLLGGLEIFEGRTEANLQRYPLASLLYTDSAPGYLSYQLNCVIQRVDGNNPHFRFLLASRQLFAFDAFHIPQKRYPHGYLFHVCEVSNKTPFPRG